MILYVSILLSLSLSVVQTLVLAQLTECVGNPAPSVGVLYGGNPQMDFFFQERLQARFDTIGLTAAGATITALDVTADPSQHNFDSFDVVWLFG
jgi:hypothetical protein